MKFKSQRFFLLFLSLFVLYNVFSYLSVSDPSVNRPNSQFLIYSAYFTYLPEDTVAFQAIGFSKCRLKADSIRLLVGNQSIPVEVQLLQSTCPNDRNCAWVDHKLYAELPITVDRTQPIRLLNGAKSVKVAMSESMMERRAGGLEVCVAPLYYFNHWIRVIEFVELYRQQGASHFYVYVSSVSQTVDDLLRLYEAKGLVTVVQWPELPKVDSTTESVFRLGQNSAIQDCMMRSKGKFVAIVDLDDYIVVKNEFLLDFLERESRDNPRVGSFTFDMVLAPQKPHSGDLSDWKSIDFRYLEEADVCDDCQWNGKPIVMPDKVDSLSPHSAFRRKKQPGILGVLGISYLEFAVSRDVGLSYHTRFALYSDHDPNSVFEKRKLLPKEVVSAMKTNFDEIMAEFTKEERNLATPDTAQVMQDCNPSVEGSCQMPYRSCRKKMKSLDAWIFPEDAEGFTHQYVVL